KNSRDLLPGRGAAEQRVRSHTLLDLEGRAVIATVDVHGHGQAAPRERIAPCAASGSIAAPTGCRRWGAPGVHSALTASGLSFAALSPRAACPTRAARRRPPSMAVQDELLEQRCARHNTADARERFEQTGERSAQA